MPRSDNSKVAVRLDVNTYIESYLKTNPLPTTPLTFKEADTLLFQIHQNVYGALPDVAIGIGLPRSECQSTAEWHYDQVGLLVRQLRSRLVLQHS
jgi:hypothetical protein